MYIPLLVFKCYEALGPLQLHVSVVSSDEDFRDAEKYHYVQIHRENISFRKKFPTPSYFLVEPHRLHYVQVWQFWLSPCGQGLEVESGRGKACHWQCFFQPTCRIYWKYEEQGGNKSSSNIHPHVAVLLLGGSLDLTFNPLPMPWV